MGIKREQYYRKNGLLFNMKYYQIGTGEEPIWEEEPEMDTKPKPKPKPKPKISIVIPFYWMKNWQFFLTRCLESIEKQTFKDYEVILTKAGSMPINSNRAMQVAKGEIIKILFMDDWLDTSYYLMEMYNAFSSLNVHWVITAADTNRIPMWTDNLETGNNRLGSPSALAFRNTEDKLLFDEKLSWLLDVELYARLYKKFGKPFILTNISVGIGIHDGQMTNILTYEQKMAEHAYINERNKINTK